MDHLARLREVIRGRGATPHVPELRELSYEPVGADGLPIDRVQTGVPALEGARVVETTHGRIVVVEHEVDGDTAYGTTARVGEFDLVDVEALSMLVGRPVDGTMARGHAPTFFDIETTGLSGGAGTVAFLVGVGYFERGVFRTVQYFLDGFSGERALLSAVADLLRERPLVVSYNGRTFDMPVMETRWLFHRMTPPLDGLEHVDMLPPARRLWRAAADGERSCRLVALEASRFGMVRVGDVPGWEIPQRYFEFVRSGETTLLEPVLLHNRLDLLSLAAVTARAQRLVREGPGAAADPHECLALGRVYERAGSVEAAESCYRETAERGGGERVVAEEAWCRLARLLRRARRFEESAAAWRAIVRLGRRGSRATREAVEALAVHHEHRQHDLPGARALAQQALASAADPAGRAAARHRLARIERKLRTPPRIGPSASLLPRTD